MLFFTSLIVVSPYLGTGLKIYGVFQPSLNGSISLSYTIDNGSVFTNSHTASGSGTDQHNYLLIDTGPLTSGNHTLTVNLSAVIEQALIVDYILYTPSFSTLAGMPNLTVVAAPSSTSLGGFASATSSALADSNSNSRKSPTGAIAGGVIGGVAILSFFLALFFWLRKRRARLNKRMSPIPPHISLSFTENTP